MTIINSVIIGGGSGDEVEAYALGDAKNAVKDDKVNLNFSANVLSSEEDISVVVDGLSNLRHGYITRDCVSFVGRYSWSSDTYFTTFKKVGDVWEERHKTEVYLGYVVAKSPYGLFLSHDNAWKAVDGVLSSLEYRPSARSYEPKKAVQMSATGEYCAFATYTDSKYKVVVYYKNKPLKVLNEWSKTSQTYAECFFVRKNGVDYLFLDGGIPYSGTKNNYAYRLSPTGVEYLGVFTTTLNTSGTYHSYVGSVGDKDSVIFTTSNDDHIYLDTLNLLRADIDLSAKTCKLFSLSDEKASFINLLSDVYGVTGGDLFFEPTGDANITQPLNNAIVTFDEGTREFRPFLSQATLGNRVYYSAEERVLFELKDLSARFSLYRKLLPFEQSYVASQPSTATYYKDQTLTGFVKENNNGVLKVSTVEDPNNPPPAVPDEVGLNATITYGGGISINPNLVIASGVTKSGTDLSGFTNNNSYTVTEASPFTSLSSVSFFDIVMCATRSADGGYYHWLAGLTDSANAYRGFDMRTQGNDFLEVNIYHEDGTSTYLKSGTTLPTNTKTFIKLSYNSSSGYTMSFSSDGISYTQVASAATTKPMDTTPPTLFLGWRPQKQQATYYWNGTIHLADCYFNVNGTKIWSGTKVNFGSVGVGYGYFRNPLSKPSDKYISYEGGLLKEDNIQGGKATTLNIILGRSVDMGSWTSDTEGYLSARDSVVLGVNKKLPTPVYLWHDLSYITPAVPETIEAVVDLDANTVSLPASWKTLDGVVYEYPNGFPETQASALMLNADVIGSPTISSLSGDVSGFTTSDFLRVPYKYWQEDLSTPGSGFDIDIAFSVDTQVSPGQYVLGGSTTNAPITLGFTSAGNMEVDVYCTAETTKTFRMSYAGAIEPGNRYVFRIGYNTFTGYYVTRSTNNGAPETLVTNSTTTPPYMYSLSELWLGRAAYDLVATGLVVHLADCAIYVNGEKKWEGFDTTVGEAGLYVTKTGDSCGLAISSTSPAGVDSSAVIGTVELDANGAIISYSPSGKVIFNGIDVTEHVTEVEVYVGPTRYTISEIPYSVLSEKGILGESGFYTVTKVKPKTGYFFAGDISYSATSVSLNYVPGFKVLQFGTFKDGQYSTFTGELTFKKVEGYMPAA